MARLFCFLFCLLFYHSNIYAQGCCAGGSGSPIAGNISQGVLQQNQVEFGFNYQYANSNDIYYGNKLDTVASNKIDKLNSNYLYFRTAYGISKRLTLSMDVGYYINRTLVRNHPENIDNTQQSKGFSDIIIFPRYDVYNKSSEKSNTEITLGIGFKIPIGTYNDSTLVYVDPNNGDEYYTTSAIMVQPTTGAPDLLFYAFVLHEFKQIKLRVFANTLYVKKGWNPLGEKFGDYFGVNLFVGKTFKRKFGTTLQLKGERIAPMQAAPGVDLLALYNVDMASTGSKLISLIPQVSYSRKSLSFFMMYEIPLYQNMNGTQIGVEHILTMGINYRFIPKSPWKATDIKKAN